MRLLTSILFLFFTCSVLAQDKDTTINKFDDNGKRHGMWWQSCSCPDGSSHCHEFGRYDHGRKMNIWYKLNGGNELLAEETYRDNALDGFAKYYEDGHLVTTGYYRGMNPENAFDTIMVTDPETGKESLKRISTDRGSLKHGLWKFYDEETGRLTKEEEYQVDELIYRKEYPLSKQDSLANLQQEAKLPHNQKRNYTPPPKFFNYLDFK